MKNAAEDLFLFDIPSSKDGGISQRELYEETARRKGDPPPDFIEIGGRAPPASMVYLLDWFIDLNMDRGGSGFGPANITSGMIHDWARGKGLYPLRPFDFDVLRILNRVWLKAYSELNPPESPQK